MRKAANKIILMMLFYTFMNGVLMAQSTIQLKLAFLGIHPFEEKNENLFENRIDANGLFVTEPCLVLAYENFLLSDTFSWRGMFGFISDAASKPGMFLHLGVKQRLVQVWRNSLSVGVGGNLYGRDSWATIPGYETDNSWRANGNWEYKFGIMAELEYALFLNDNNDITLSLLYGHQPNTFTFSIGYKYWLSSVIKNPRKCGSCPFQKKTNKHWNP